MSRVLARHVVDRCLRGNVRTEPVRNPSAEGCRGDAVLKSYLRIAFQLLLEQQI